MAETVAEYPLTAPPPAEATFVPSGTLPDYSEMIMAAVEAMNDKNGSNKTAIAKYVESTNNDLPAAHTTLLAHHLNKLKQEGQLVMLNNNYMKPDPNAPPRRGRGRPPKAKTSLPAGAVVTSPPRPRGRPPKPRDPFADPPPPKASPAGSGRPRGRPPKKAKTTAAAPPPASTAGGTPRGRGRPPKVKPAAEPVAV